MHGYPVMRVVEYQVPEPIATPPGTEVFFYLISLLSPVIIIIIQTHTVYLIVNTNYYLTCL